LPGGAAASPALYVTEEQYRVLSNQEPYSKSKLELKSNLSEILQVNIYF